MDPELLSFNLDRGMLLRGSEMIGNSLQYQKWIVQWVKGEAPPPAKPRLPGSPLRKLRR
jgi:hypothetical protein